VFGLHRGGDPIYESHLAVLTGAVAAIAFAFSALAVAASTSEINARSKPRSALLCAGPKTIASRQQSLRDAGVPSVTKAGGVSAASMARSPAVHGKTVRLLQANRASAGATLVSARRSEVILFMTDAQLEKFMNSKDWTVGVDAGVRSSRAGRSYDSETLRQTVVHLCSVKKG